MKKLWNDTTQREHWKGGGGNGRSKIQEGEKPKKRTRTRRNRKRSEEGLERRGGKYSTKEKCSGRIEQYYHNMDLTEETGEGGNGDNNQNIFQKPLIQDQKKQKTKKITKTRRGPQTNSSSKKWREEDIKGYRKRGTNDYQYTKGRCCESRRKKDSRDKKKTAYKRRKVRGPKVPPGRAYTNQRQRGIFNWMPKAPHTTRKKTLSGKKNNCREGGAQSQIPET